MMLYIISLLLYCAALYLRLVVSCCVLFSGVWTWSVQWNCGKLLFNKNSDLPDDGCNIISVFYNRMEAVTPCMTLLNAAAKRT